MVEELLSKGRRAAVAGALALTVGLAGCSGGDGGAQGDGQDTGATTAPAGSRTPTDVPTQAAANGLIPDLVERIEPSVVAVVTDGGEGSGVVWDDAGTIVTNNHVIQSARQVEVVFQTGERVEASVRATDPRTDLAVLDTGRAGLSPATFAAASPRVGELAVAIGNPLGFENSVTAGIVSGLNRTIPGAAQQGQQALVDLLQTDAAISPGNSGGALVDAAGQIIGINVAYIPPQTAGAVSIGFAIPSPRVTDVVGQLLEDGTVEHAYIGITLRDMTAGLAAQFDAPVDFGVLVTGVGQGTPAAGTLEPGDIIVAAGGTETRTGDDLISVIATHRPGDELELEVYRGDSQETTSVTLADRPS